MAIFYAIVTSETVLCKHNNQTYAKTNVIGRTTGKGEKTFTQNCVIYRPTKQLTSSHKILRPGVVLKLVTGKPKIENNVLTVYNPEIQIISLPGFNIPD